MKPTLLKDWMGEDVTGWCLSEKLDGWRLLWDGKRYLTRQGNELECPASWYVGMPDLPLDGELFAGRGKFNQIQRLIADGFAGLKFVVFDVPIEVEFDKRLRLIATTPLPAHCEKMEHRKCNGVEDLMQAADVIVNAGGEGVVVRNPETPYEAGRSSSIQRWVPQDPALNRVA